MLMHFTRTLWFSFKMLMQCEENLVFLQDVAEFVANTWFSFNIQLTLFEDDDMVLLTLDLPRPIDYCKYQSLL